MHTPRLLEPPLDGETTRRIVHTLAEARDPAIHAGGGVPLADAAEELRELTTRMCIPAAYSLMGKGALPDCRSNEITSASGRRRTGTPCCH